MLSKSGYPLNPYYNNGDNDGDDDDDDGGQRSIPLFAAGIELLGLSAPSHTNCKLELKMYLLDLNIANRLQHFVYQE